MKSKQREAHITKWQQSGQTKKAYSKEFGIKYATFISWFKKKVPFLGGRFLKLENSREADRLEIVLPNGIRIYSCQKLDLRLLKDLQNV